MATATLPPLIWVEPPPSSLITLALSDCYDKRAEILPHSLVFGFNVAPKIMSQDEEIWRATSSYIDDVYVDENIASSRRFKDHLECFGLVCKASELLQDGVNVLWRHVSGDREKLCWRLGSDVLEGLPLITRWNGNGLTFWIDARSLGMGVALEDNGSIIEDTCWLRPKNDMQHMNLAKLDTTLKGINLALQWYTTVLHIVMDSACTQRWISDALTIRAWLTTKASSEMLIQRQLAKLTETEYNLSVDVALVKLAVNWADALTLVPHHWLLLLRLV